MRSAQWLARSAQDAITLQKKMTDPSFEGTFAYLFQGEGSLLFKTADAPPLPAPRLESLEDHAAAPQERVLAGRSYLWAEVPLGKKQTLILLRPQGFFEGFMRDQGSNLAGGLLAIGFLLLALASALLRLLLRPLEEMNHATAIIVGGELSARLSTREKAPLGPLAENFNNLADRLESNVLDSLAKQNQLEAILGSMNSGVIAVDQHDKILIFNPFAQSIFGVREEAIGKDIHQVIQNTDLDHMMQVWDSFQELELKPSSKTVVRYKTTNLTSERGYQRGKVTVIQDVTDLKKLELMRSQFVANVSHELKTPLTSIKGFTETLRSVDDPRTKDKFLDIIDAESERLRRLIEDILSLSAIEHQSEGQKEIVEAAERTKSTLSLLEGQARAKNVDLTLLIKGRPRFWGNEDQYRQLLINLLDNAIKYTEPHGRVKVRLEEVEDQVRLTLSDTGTGIGAEHLERIFERFYRVDASRDRAKGGTGLGLAIVKHIVLNFGGSIRVQSKVGRGTTFFITFPAYRQESEPLDKSITALAFHEPLQDPSGGMNPGPP